MNLVIDIGNTQVKSAIFKGNTLIKKDVFLKDDLIRTLERIATLYPVSNAILSSVGTINDLDINKIRKIFKLILLDHNTKIPFTNLYDTPKTLGVDRIALVAAAVSQFPKRNTLIFDAGSCLTYDLVNKKNEYYGGAISPGVKMRYKALHSYTSNLPELDPKIEVPKIGNTTENAIHLGVLNGIILEIEGVIKQFKDKYDKLTVILTGGDTIFLAKNLKSTIFANPNFLLEGLNHILIYNSDE